MSALSRLMRGDESRNVARVTREPILMTSPQMALIIAFDPIAAQSGLRLVCEHCARANDHELVTDNRPEDQTWTIDCRCTQRRFPRASLAHTMTPSGDLIGLAEELLKGTGLVIRCPNRPSQCLTTPLTMQTTSTGVTYRCQCWQIEVGAGVYRFEKKQRAVTQ